MADLSSDPLVELYHSLCKAFQTKLDSGDATAADLGVVRQFLKDNDINCDLAGLRKAPDDTAAAEFIKSLPFLPTPE